MAEEQITVSGTVDATPEQLFALLSDPARHPDIDSVDMLRGADGNELLSAVGDTFVMTMNNPLLNDYRTRNTVVAFERDRVIGWSVELHPEDDHSDKLGDMKPGGHTYTWHLEPAGSGTRVTEVYDWSGVPDERFKSRCPLLTADQLADSIERAGRAAG